MSLPQSAAPARLRRLGLAAFTAALALCAAQVPAAPESAQQFDNKLQGLKEEALQMNRDVLALEQFGLYADHSRTTVYVGVKVGGFVLTDITAQINDFPPVSHNYAEGESAALRKDGWHRLMRMSLPPGTYRLHAEFKGRFFDSKPNEPPITGKLDTLFEKGLSDVDLLLPISRNTRLDKPGLPEVSRLEARRLRPSRNVWLPHPDKFESSVSTTSLGGESDPQYHYALFLYYDNQFFSALTELLDIAQTVPDPKALPPEFDTLLADSYLNYGMPAPAEQIYRKVAATSKDAVAVARAKLELARFEYQRGHLTEAAEDLRNMRATLPKQVRDDWCLLIANVLLAQGRYNEAIDALTKADIDDFPGAVRYNLAVALMRDGRIAEGRKQLNKVGTMSVATDDDLALRDKANVTLGYHYLQAQQGETAKEIFGRVRTRGPFSNRALLGLGWAEIAPVAGAKEKPIEAEGSTTTDTHSLGSTLRPGFVDPNLRSKLKLGDKAGVGMAEADRDALIRALLPWIELAKRDPMDPAVEEGMLATAWAYDKLRAYEQSLGRYQEAITALETARKRMDDAVKSIRDGTMVYTMIRDDLDAERGWKWRLSNLADTPETYFLQSLLAEHRYQEPLKSYRDAKQITRMLEGWRDRLNTVVDRGYGAKPAIAQRVKRAKEEWRAPWAGMVVWLRYDALLAPPGLYDAPLQVATAPLDLVTADTPDAFDGAGERATPLLRRINEFKPRLNEAVSSQSRWLTDLANIELEGQKKQIERYLTEARFAVARIYDRQRQEK